MKMSKLIHPKMKKVPNPYETHLVFRPDERRIVEPIAKMFGFSISYLVGDDDLGEIRLLYCTKRASTFNKIQEDLDIFLCHLEPDTRPIRKKIEYTMLDEKYIMTYGAMGHLKQIPLG